MWPCTHIYELLPDTCYAYVLRVDNVDSSASTLLLAELWNKQEIIDINWLYSYDIRFVVLIQFRSNNLLYTYYIFFLLLK